MSMMWIWFLAALVAIVSLVVLGFILYRVNKPHLKKRAAAQSRLDQKIGHQKKGPVPSAETGKTPARAESGTGSDTGNLISSIFAVVGVAVVALIVWWSVPWQQVGSLLKTPSPSLGTVWECVKDHWLWIVLILGGSAGALSIVQTMVKAPWARPLQGVLVAAMTLLFVVLPFIGWFNEPPKPPEQAARSEIPLASSPQSEWPKLVIPAGGRSENIPVPPYMHAMFIGNNFRVHNVYQDRSECSESCTDGPLAAVYVTSKDTKNQNIVSYYYAPMN